MKTLQTIVKNKARVLVAFVFAMVLAVSGLLSVRNSPSHMAASAVMESVNAESTSLDTVAAPAPKPDSATVVENRVTEESAKAAAEAASKTKSLGSGEASYYGRGFAGRPTANGETFNPAEMTAAHRTLPFGSKLRVTNKQNGRSVIVRVNDRGPYAHNRVIDLSQGAAEKIGMIHSGTAQVKLELIS